MTAKREGPLMSIPPFVVKATCMASLGGILFGYDMGVVAGALPQLKEDFHLSERQQEGVVGLLYLGAGLGACFGGIICDRLGRKTGILITDGIFIAGAAILFLATSVHVLYLGRIVVGFGISVSGIADVAYLHEMAPVDWRGSLVSVNEGCISLGFLFAFLAGFLLNERASGWRYMFGISGIIALLQLVGMWTLPESPLWLKEQGRIEEHNAALRMIHGGEEQLPTDEEGGTEANDQLDIPARGQPSPNTDDQCDTLSSTVILSPSSGRHRKLYETISLYHKQISIALFLAVFQQLSGQASVLNFTPSIFSSLEKENTLVMVYIGVVKLSVTVLVIWRIEYVGRRLLLLIGMSVLAVGQFLVAIAFRQGLVTSYDSIPWAMIGVLCVVIGYSFSFGPLTWLLTSELVPTNIRGRTLGSATVVTYLVATLVTSTFLSMQSILGSCAVFVLYGLVTAFGVVFAFLAVPETSGMNVEEIDSALRSMWLWKRTRQDGTDLEPTIAPRYEVIEFT